MTTRLLFVYTLLESFVVILSANKEGCQTPRGQAGNCVSIQYCPFLSNLHRQVPLSEENRLYLALSACSEDGLKVCCDRQDDGILFEIKPADDVGTRTVTDKESCKTFDNEEGECIFVKSCPSLRALLEHPPFTLEKQIRLRKSGCGYVGINAKVCCPRTPQENPGRGGDVVPKGPIVSNLLPPLSICGPVSVNRIKGGEIAEVDEFPWMALLEYKTPKRITLNCGGSLINNRYVMTAAHCVVGKDLPQNWILENVRLGEYDTSTQKDCSHPTICNDGPLTVEIEEKVVHEGYISTSVSQHNDIAILRLANEVRFTEYIKPICLPSYAEILSKSYIGQNSTVAGWGLTENDTSSNVLRKVELVMKNLQQCSMVYGVRRDLQLKQLCAGGERGRDSCRGDSGGPLMVTNTIGDNVNFFALGIVSYGPTDCGLERWPGVYTRVSSYLPWIISKLRP